MPPYLTFMTAKVKIKLPSYFFLIPMAETIHKINDILLISLQILVKSFVSNITINLSYNLSKYIQHKHMFENRLKWVVYITHCNLLVLLG